MLYYSGVDQCCITVEWISVVLQWSGSVLFYSGVDQCCITVEWISVVLQSGELVSHSS